MTRDAQSVSFEIIYSPLYCMYEIVVALPSLSPLDMNLSADDEVCTPMFENDKIHKIWKIREFNISSYIAHTIDYTPGARRHNSAHSPYMN